MDITIQLPEKISSNSTYSGAHWSKRSKMAPDWHSLLKEHKHNIIEESEYPIHLLFMFTFKEKPLDWVNCSMMAKMLEDGMVYFKMIPDDNPKIVAGGSIISRKGNKNEVQIITVKNQLFYDSFKR